jgi:hypothetical protein
MSLATPIVSGHTNVARLKLILPPGPPARCGQVPLPAAEERAGLSPQMARKPWAIKAKSWGLLTFKPSAVQAVNGVSAGNLPDFGSWTSDGSWSPDGKWLAAVSGGKVILIDAMNPSHHRSLGAAGDAGLVWSPDSKYLLLQRSQLSCGLLSMSESLEALEVGTGKRTMIKSSHCEVYAGWHGWVDPAAVQ